MRVKHFVETAGFYHDGTKYGEDLDTLINNWLQGNSGIRVLDIKYTGNVSGYADSGVSGFDTNYSALVIYEEVADDSEV